VPGVIVSERAVKHVRKNLGEHLRAVRKERGFSQQDLGERAGLSGKFVGEVERGEKSISVDSLYRIAVALDIPLRQLTDVSNTTAASRPDVERLLALVGAVRSRSRLTTAYRALRELFPEGRRRSG
jgi:transcriptional regulator with XRE-family HTH domain